MVHKVEKDNGKAEDMQGEMMQFYGDLAGKIVPRDQKPVEETSMDGGHE